MARRVCERDYYVADLMGIRDDVDEDERILTVRPKPSGPASPIDTPNQRNATAEEE